VRLDRRTAAVLSYLALEGETPKYKLAGLLWPDSPEATAKNNMRQLLRRLRTTAGADLVVGEERITLAEGVEADAAWLQARSFAGEHAAALELEGELLAGLEYDDAPDLEEWLLGAREGLVPCGGTRRRPRPSASSARATSRRRSASQAGRSSSTHFPRRRTGGSCGCTTSRATGRPPWSAMSG
jgi:hypothetical protein